jgi:mono/diheme cytochrome c family protein
MTFIFYYYYAWERNTGRMPVFLAAMYFIIAWGSLFAINGILTFMLTPDGWTLANKDIFAAFFNPTFWPSLFLRTFVMFMLAGIFGIFIASQLTDENEDDAGLKESVIHFSLKWVIPAGLLLPIFGAWYWFALPETTVKLVQGGMVGLSGGRLEMISRFLLLGGVSVAMILAIVTVMGLKARLVNTASAIALVLVAQFAIAGGEFFREMARKPYVLYGTLYSNSVWKANAENPAWRGRSMFANARWMGNTQPMTLDHGEAVFRLQCASCHTRDGYRSIKQRTSLWTPESGFKWLPTMADQGVMPPFVGDANDRAALVSYLLTLNGTKVQPSEVLAKGLAAETLAVAPAAAPTPATAPASAQGGAK